MSVPAWKQAILDRKRKQEDEQKQKEAEEAAYLSALPAWKRAIVKKQKEKNQSLSPGSTLDRTGKHEPVSSTPTVTPSNKWMTAVQKIREVSPKVSNRPAWGGNEPTTASQTSPKASNRPAWAKNEPTTASQTSPKASNRPAWAKSGTNTSSYGDPTAQVTLLNFGSRSGSRSGSISSYSKPPQSVPRMSRRESVTVLPDSTSSIIPVSTIPSIPSVSLRSSTSQKKPTVHVQDKRRSFEGGDVDFSKLAEMPAWKKALIMRRRASVSSEETGKLKSEQTQPNSATNNTNKTVRKQNVKHNHSTTVILPDKNTSHDETDSPSVSNDVQSSQEERQAFVPARKAPTFSEQSTQQNNLNENEGAVAIFGLKTGDKQKPKMKPSPSVSKPGPKTSTKSDVKKVSLQQVNVSRSSEDKTKIVVVNRSQAGNEGPSKLVEKEGVVHRPPIFKEVGEWASVTENDPEFTKLPLWKQALIKRRRSDIAKRSVAIVPQPSSQSLTKESPANSYSGQNAASQNKNTGLKRESQQSKQTKTQERNVVNRGQTSMKTSSLPEKKKTENTIAKFSSTTPSKNSYIPGKVQPAKKAAARPAPPPPKVKVEEEEPMFTYSFKKSHKTIDTESDSSDSSDSELEDITLTNIDEIGSDEDDSGIDKGVIVVTSYKVTSNDYTLLQRSDSTLSTDNNKNTAAVRKDEVQDNDAKPIFLDTSAAKSHRSLRRVSFSDSQLTVEHAYPKYTYHDYDDINSDEDVTGSHFPKTISMNSGLSHKVHPSLRSNNETDSDAYRYSPSKASPMKPSSGSLSAYTPSIISNYSDMLTNHLSGSGLKSTSPSKSPVKIAEEPDNVSTGNEDKPNDFYSHLNSDTAALLW